MSDLEDMDDDQWAEKYEPSGAGVTWTVFAILITIIIVCAYFLVTQ